MGLVHLANRMGVHLSDLLSGCCDWLTQALAIGCGHRRVGRALARIRITDRAGRTLLHHAAWAGRGDAVANIVSHSSSAVNLVEASGHTVLQCAATNGDACTVGLLLRAGADVKAANAQGHTALMIACSRGHLAAAELLLAAKADPCTSDGGGKTAVHWAAQAGHAALVASLIRASEGGAALRDHNGMSPLSYASLLGHDTVIDAILSHVLAAASLPHTHPASAVLGITSRDKRTALHFAAHNGHCGAARRLLDSGVDASARDTFGRTALNVAIERSQVAVVDLLASRGCGLDLEDNDGRQPLHTLCDRLGASARAASAWPPAEYDPSLDDTESFVGMCSSLLRHGADPNGRDYSGATALHLVANVCLAPAALAVAQRLLAGGADAAAIDDADWQPLHYARRKLAAVTSEEHAAAAMVEALTAAMEQAGTLGGFEPSRPRSERGQRRYLDSRGPHNFIPLEKREDVLRGERSLAGIAARLRRDVRSDLPPQRVVVLLGAGVSTAAGLPDYRSTGGIWTTQSNRDAFSAAGFHKDPYGCWLHARQIFGPAINGAITPTATHRFLLQLHEHGLLQRVYTQNVDALELAAGLPREMLVACHGSIAEARCSACGATADAKHALLHATSTPCCGTCGAPVRPGIVWFGEPLPAAFEATQTVDFEACTMLLVIGTSLKVYPFAALPNRCDLLTPRLLINREAVGPFREPDQGGHIYRDVMWLGECDEGVQELTSLLGWQGESPS